MKNFKTLFPLRILSVKPVLWALLFTLFSLGLVQIGLNKLAWGILGLVFVSYGLAHGAIDYLIDYQVKSKKDLLFFILSYVFKGTLLGLVWIIMPDVALIGFILFSAWHFGQTDFIEWKLSQGPWTFLWGMCVLMLILGFHLPETISILKQIPRLQLPYLLEHLSVDELFYVQILFIGLALLLFGVVRSTELLITIAYLLLTSTLPLLISFGIYFVFQHSFHGWKHLQKQLKISSSVMLKKAAPYTAITLLAAFFLFWKWPSFYLGILFILLSCISMPHVLSMNYFYHRK